MTQDTRWRTPRAVGLAAFVAVLVVGALISWRPWLTAERPQITATPGLAGLFSRVTVPVSAHRTACVAPVPFDPASRRAQLLVLVPAGTKPPPPLRVEATAPGYRSSAIVRRYARGVDTVISAPIAPTPRAVMGRLCVTPERGRVQLVGTNEPRSLTAAQATVDGKPVPGVSVAVTLTRPGTTTFTGELGTVADRASGLTGGIVPTWLAWLLLVLAAVATPVLVGAAFALALSRDPGSTT
jgi:hypothetical protein